MKAILCSQYCQPDDLVLADVPDPVAEPGQAVIAIKAAALNFFDILMIQGKYQIKPPFPFSPAAEVAGVIESVGAGVTSLKVGDRVVASCGHNGAREKIALPASSIVKIPDNLDFDRAAGIIIIYGTALHALEDRASPKPGETLAVLGAAGGTGLAAAIDFSAVLLAALPILADRRVIDVSGDGQDNERGNPAGARDRALALGFTINGLPIINGSSKLEAYYRDNVIGGPGAFVMPAADMRSFRDAMARKLLREVGLRNIS